MTENFLHNYKIEQMMINRGIYLSKIQKDCYRDRRQEAFRIIDKEPSISIKDLALRMGVNLGYAGNWFIAYRRYQKR